MTNPDTSTLNGALEQLGITMAENLVTMGVSDADPSDGLTTLAGKILLVPQGGGVATLTLAKTAGKQILSYADSGASPETEYCTVTATALDSNNQGVSGQSVVFKVGSTTVATETTDSNGEASYTYTSQGSGDVVLSAECSSLIQTYAVKDALYYNSGTIATGTLINLSNITTFKATFNINKKSGVSGNFGAYLDVGKDSNDFIHFGQGGANKIAYTPPWTDKTVNISAGIPTEMTLTYNGTAFILSCNGESLTCNKQYSSLGYWAVGYESNNSISDLLIIPL